MRILRPGWFIGALVTLAVTSAAIADVQIQLHPALQAAVSDGRTLAEIHRNASRYKLVFCGGVLSERSTGNFDCKLLFRRKDVTQPTGFLNVGLTRDPVTGGFDVDWVAVMKLPLGPYPDSQ